MQFCMLGTSDHGCVRCPGSGTEQASWTAVMKVAFDWNPTTRMPLPEPEMEWLG